MTPEQRIPDELAALGELAKTPEGNIIELRLIAHFPERLTPEQRIPDEMAPKKVIVHANSETHELEVESFSDLKEKVIGLIGIEDIDLKINNKIMDEKTEFESKVHVDVAVKVNVDGMFSIL